MGKDRTRYRRHCWDHWAIFAYEAFVVNKTVLMLNFLSVVMMLWVGRRMSLFLGATSYIFKSDKTHNDCNLNGSEGNIDRGRETERERVKWSEKWSCSVVSNSLRPPGLQLTRLLRPWDFQGKSAGAGCHCLLQKGERETSNMAIHVHNPWIWWWGYLYYSFNLSSGLKVLKIRSW